MQSLPPPSKVLESLQIPTCLACRGSCKADIPAVIQAAAAEASKDAAAAVLSADQKLREAENAIAAMRSRLDQQGAELVSARSTAENTAKAGLLPSTLTNSCPYAILASDYKFDDAATVSC